METRREVERLAGVYREYARTGAPRTRWSLDNAGNRAIAAERRARIRTLLAARGMPPLGACDILDVGCGTGDVLAELVSLGARPARCHGVDLRPDAIDVARSRHAAIRFEPGNAESLPVGDACVDLVLAFTVFTSILDATMAERVAAEMTRVLRPRGAVLWYDFRYDNPANPHVRGVGRRRIARLFPGLTPHLESLTVLPPLARRLGKTTPWAYPLLARVSPLRTHYLGLLRRAH
jgi:ubiquinone/menaquinone biosynthesis C-methylase UbiE